MNGKSAVSVSYDRKIVTCSVDKTTTICDVIKTVTSSDDYLSYIVFECCEGVGRMLPANSSVLKRVRSWGADRNKHSLVVRRVDKSTCEMATISCVKRKVKRLAALIKSHVVTDKLSMQTTLCKNLNANSDVTKHFAKDLQSFVPDELHGKLSVMKRFIRDSEFYNHRKRADGADDTFLTLPARTRGDGQDEDDRVVPLNRTFFKYCNMDIAFLDETCAERDVSELNQDEIYAAMMSDSESAFGDDSDCSSVCDLEKNVSYFSEVDDVMESYMVTIVEAGVQSDEGFSSTGSDDK
ncbi:hypothetical protein DPMN_009482 [Dreissena polymorpha]|uniref:Uncharacterized protein n=1 Tax=Dreissena polymorpha TaxID=45954 RepID=A0A9D4N063_DREPO|nr:hypothetical protein DPMN_009482 [Dreissena polymorpha]